MFLGKIFTIGLSSALVGGLVLVGNAPQAEAKAPKDTNILSLSITVQGEGADQPMPPKPGVPTSWTAPQENNCYPQPDKKEIDPKTGKEINVPQPDECRMENIIGARGTTYNTGIATWPDSQILIPWSPTAGYDFRGRDPFPSPLAPSDDPKGDYVNLYYGACQLAWKVIDFEGFRGPYAPKGVHWGLTEEWYVDGNRNVVPGPKNAEYGKCIWPSIKQVANTCPTEAGPTFGSGPSGTGLPVEIAPGVYDPTSQYKKVGPIPVNSGGGTIAYTKLGKSLKNGSFDGLSSKQKAAMIENCVQENIFEQFDFKVTHPGNYKVEGPGKTVKCSYTQFLSFIEFTGCNDPVTTNYKNEGWVDCDGVMNPGVNNTYDFSCKRVTVTCEAGDSRCEANAPAGAIICVYDKPTLTEPNKMKIDYLDVPIQVGATGEKWILDWGNLVVKNMPGKETNRWTEWIVEKGSTPGREDLNASDKNQSFKGEFEGKRVLRWEGEKSSAGVDKRWAETLDMNWFMASNQDKFFRVHQDRDFTWEKRINMENWDPSFSNLNVDIPQTCRSKTFTFDLLRDRNAGGTLTR
jgi:hypothetical protein